MKNLALVLFGILASTITFSQRSCHTMENHERLLLDNPNHAFELQEIENFTSNVIASGQVNIEKGMLECDRNKRSDCNY
jgi:hypothetical protein